MATTTTSDTTKLRTLIEQALELEELEPDLYRSKQLWTPNGARGVFGGQVVAQALSAATRTVPHEYHVHSLQSYFLLPGDHTKPIYYRVKRLRDGRTYVTRQVEASQRGRCIFNLSCSFQIPETSHLDHQYEMPKVPPPEAVKSQEENLRLWYADETLPEKYRQLIKMRLESHPFPIESKPINRARAQDMLQPPKAEPRQLVWMKAKGQLPDDLRFHHCVAAYLSDEYLLNTSLLVHQITGFSRPRLKMIASLDHMIWFHQPFRADQWLLYEMESSRTIGGRGLTFGRIYTLDGTLVMSSAQEGVIRADPVNKEGSPVRVPRPLSDNAAETKPKL
ncbi:acyl-coenzyme A thioesterase 8 [Cladochytrium replicatum]|nr:acyl-coenzyme A thioesterase 8 [Cladochytrium replicatum]